MTHASAHAKQAADREVTTDLTPYEHLLES